MKHTNLVNVDNGITKAWRFTLILPTDALLLAAMVRATSRATMHPTAASRAAHGQTSPRNHWRKMERVLSHSSKRTTYWTAVVCLPVDAACGDTTEVWRDY